MDFASRNRAAMRNVNPPGYCPPGYAPPGHAGHAPNPPGDVVPDPVPPAPAPPIATDGRVAGIDGMLDQVAEALVRQVSADHDLQVRVGTAAGVAMGETILTGLFIGAVVKWAWNALPER